MVEVCDVDNYKLVNYIHGCVCRTGSLSAEQEAEYADDVDFLFAKLKLAKDNKKVCCCIQTS